MVNVLDQLDTSKAPQPQAQKKYSCGLERNPELLKFLELLKKYRGVVRVYDKGNGLRLWFPNPLTRANAEERRYLSNLLYSGKTVPFLACLFDDGDWNTARICWFIGMGRGTVKKEGGGASSQLQRK